jgi:cell division protein FtsB
MAEFRKNKKVSNFLYSKPVLVILAVVAIFFAINIVSIAKKSGETKVNKDLALAKVNELSANQTKLEEDIAKLSTSQGQEDAVRDKFRVTKDGEGLIIITNNKNTIPPPPAPPETGFWAFLKSLFK